MKKFIVVTIFQFIVIFGFTQIRVGQLLCENLTNPVGIGTSQPQFSWQITSDNRNVMQTSYEIRGSSNPTSLAMLSQ